MIPNLSLSCLLKYIDFSFCVSKAMSPVKTKTPMKDKAKSMAGLLKNIFTTEAISNPNNPINKKAPNDVKSFVVL